MAEYMDYDDTLYDASEHSKRAKIKSWISIILSVAFLLSAVIFVIVRSPKNVRTKFDAVTGAWHEINSDDLKNADAYKNGEFYKLYTAFQNDETFKYNESFKEEFKSVYEVISADKKQLSTEKVYSFEQENSLILALPYVLTQDKTAKASENDNSVRGTIGTDIVIIPYTVTADNSAQILNPIRYSLCFYNETTGARYIESRYVKSDSFRLNFYKISIEIEDKKNIKSVDAKLTLSDAISKENADKLTFYNAISLKHGDEKSYKTISGGNRADFDITKHLVSANTQTDATVIINFDDDIYDNFKSFEVKGSYTKFRIIVN